VVELLRSVRTLAQKLDGHTGGAQLLGTEANAEKLVCAIARVVVRVPAVFASSAHESTRC